ncbi:B3/4 domain-containing protein [Culicoidibacter larvae]|uniref:B3/B4 tRNA-binding domain-containing protein n=1 Tax=Culicoidibacter larvae TaxID=2579976 RepID=A0A5R8Q7S7_9FIRM|nr:phenylalanine--tRNA ligase beta subunit-related protein [Culicoidibacter larvae]TLG71523.1 hypothetical protein FEZ08_10535 [Culicoidibacter larvae]
MNRIIVESAFWELFPEAEIQILVVKAIDNHVVEAKNDYFAALLADGANDAGQYLTDANFSQNRVVAEWREAFSKFKTKKGARASIEALLKRASQGHEFRPINPLVDIYNSVSLQFAVPCGGEDIDTIEGDLRLGKAQGRESFLPLGADADAPALPGEIIYYDDAGAICRCLNWREAQRTMLTEDTVNAVLVIEAINREQAMRAREAAAKMKQLLDGYFNVESVTYQLSVENPEIVL